MLYLFGALGLAFLALFGALGFEHSRVVTWRDRAHAAEANLAAAQERAAAQTELWIAQQRASEAKARRDADERRSQFDALEARVLALPHGGRCVAPRDADRLLADIERAANAAGLATVGGADPDGVPAGSQAGRRR